MDALSLANHLLNFIAPALFVAFVLALLSALTSRNTPDGSRLRALWRSFCFDAAAGILALAAGLIAFGRDGKMLSYAALALACASSRWLARRGPRGG